MKISNIKKCLASFLAVPLLALSVSAVVPALTPTSAGAAANSGGTYTLSSGAKNAKGTDTPDDLFGTEGMITKIINVLLFLIAAVSVVMLIIGGFRYIVSQGDSTKVTSAKNTILYAIIGLIIAILAYAIVNFVMGQLGINGSGS